MQPGQCRFSHPAMCVDDKQCKASRCRQLHLIDICDQFDSCSVQWKCNKRHAKGWDKRSSNRMFYLLLLSHRLTASIAACWNVGYCKYGDKCEYSHADNCPKGNDCAIETCQLFHYIPFCKSTHCSIRPKCNSRHSDGWDPASAERGALVWTLSFYN